MKSASPEPRRVRNPRGQGGLLREEIILACTRLLDRSGSELTLSLRAIAREAHVAAPSVSRHFHDLAEIIDAVIAQQVQAFHAHLCEAHALVSQPRDRLRALARAYVDFGIQMPSRYRVLFNRVALPLWNDPDRSMEETSPMMMRTFDMIAGAVQECIDGGIALQGDAKLSAVLLWYSCHGLVTLRQSITSFPWPDLDEAIDEILQRTVGFTE
ncbi:MAG: TetR/AcrR family transcriptional regulator [Acidimicrobiales bacterium]